MKARLKLFVGDGGLCEGDPDSQSAVLPLAEFARIISDATIRNRTWLQDFADEYVAVSPDLYEVLCAYDTVHQVRA